MAKFNEFKWNDDDYQLDFNTEHSEPVVPDVNETVQKKSKTKKQNTWLAGLAGGVAGALIMMAAMPIYSYFAEKKSASGEPFKITNESGNETKPSSVQQVTYNAGERKELTTKEIGYKVGPAVVGVVTKSRYSGFFGQQSSGSGSGIVISEDGKIVTNNHVIEGADSVTVVLNNGKEYEATLLGSDDKTDLAVLKIDAPDLTKAVLGDSDLLEAGERAVAIGNPLGTEFAGTLTQGIISALNRTVTVDNKTYNMIQTDAAINPGNSGGALVNSYGEVIGINTVKVSSSEIEGLGFAIPINEAKPIIEDLVNFGYVKGRPLIGLSLRYITPQEAEYYNIPSAGLFVVEVSQYSGAEKAGIRRGDVILSCEGKEVTSVEQLNDIRDKHKAGETIKMVINREGKKITINVELTEDKPAYTNQ